MNDRNIKPRPKKRKVRPSGERAVLRLAGHLKSMAHGRPDAARLTKAADVLLALMAAMHLDAEGEAGPLCKLVEDGGSIGNRWNADASKPRLPMFAVSPTNQAERRRITPIERSITKHVEKMLASGKTTREVAAFALAEMRERIPGLTLEDPLDWRARTPDGEIVSAAVAKLGPKRSSYTHAEIAVTIVHALFRQFGIEPSRATGTKKKTAA